MNSKKRTRKRLRLKGYGYKTPGYYFVTVCTNNRKCLFGKILNGKMNLNAAGQMIEQVLYAIPEYYFGWTVDSFIVMPNHIHAILVLQAGPARGPAPTISLPKLMCNIKSYTITRYRHGVQKHHWEPFYQCLWQRGYHDHIIRNNDSLNKIRKYILNNPTQWAIDKNNQLLTQQCN